MAMLIYISNYTVLLHTMEEFGTLLIDIFDKSTNKYFVGVVHDFDLKNHKFFTTSIKIISQMIVEGLDHKSEFTTTDIIKNENNDVNEIKLYSNYYKYDYIIFLHPSEMSKETYDVLYNPIYYHENVKRII